MHARKNLLLIFLSSVLLGVVALCYIALLRGTSPLLAAALVLALGALALAPVWLARWRELCRTLRGLGWRGWGLLLWVVLVGMVGGVLALGEALTLAQGFADGVGDGTVFFLEKFETIFVLLLAFWLLGERLSVRFWCLAGVAVLASFLLGLPSYLFSRSVEIFYFTIPAGGASLKIPTFLPTVFFQANFLRLVLLALLAGCAFGSGVVAGRALVRRVEWRLILLLVVLLGAAALLPALLLGWSAVAVLTADQWWFLVAAAVLLLGSLALYFAGLQNSRASIAAIGLLGFAPTLLLGQALFFGQEIHALQLLGIFLIVFAWAKLVWTRAYELGAHTDRHLDLQ